MADYSGFYITSNTIDFGLQTANALNISVGSQMMQPIYRGKLGGEYVYSIGSIPIGASDIIIVGYE